MIPRQARDLGWRCSIANLNLRGTEDFVEQAIALGNGLDDLVFFAGDGFGTVHRGRVKIGVVRLDDGDTLGGEDLVKGFEDMAQTGILEVVLGPFEIIENRENLVEQSFVGKPGQKRPLGFMALLLILVVSQSALEFVVQGSDLFFKK